MIPGAGQENPTDSAHSRHRSGRGRMAISGRRGGGIIVPVNGAQLAAGSQYAVRLPQESIGALRM